MNEVKSLTKVNISISQGLSAAKRIIPIIDIENSIDSNKDKQELKIIDANIIFQDVNFYYKSNTESLVLKKMYWI